MTEQPDQTRPNNSEPNGIGAQAEWSVNGQLARGVLIATAPELQSTSWSVSMFRDGVWWPADRTSWAKIVAEADRGTLIHLTAEEGGTGVYIDVEEYERRQTPKGDQ